MVFQEPKAEFVTIDLGVDAQTAGSDPAGYETCTGPLAPSNRCDYSGTFWLDGSGNEYNPSAVPEP